MPSRRISNSLITAIVLLIVVIEIGIPVRAFYSLKPGYSTDVHLYEVWGEQVREFGLVNAHKNVRPNYPQASLLIFSLPQSLKHILQSAGLEIGTGTARLLTKSPANVADLFISILLFLFIGYLKKWKLGICAGALYWFHPVAIYNSAYWGQTDSIFTMCILLSLILILFPRRGSAVLSGIAGMLAVFMKPQAVVFLPLLFILASGRIRTLLLFTISAELTALIFFVPFFGTQSMPYAIEVFTGAVGYFPTLTKQAYNLWWTLFADQANGKSDLDLMFGLIKYRHVGLILFGALYAIVIVKLMPFLRQKTNLSNKKGMHRMISSFLAMSTVAYAFFTVNTQMHERYLFPFIVFGLPLVFLVPKFWRIYLLGSFASLMNHMGVLQFGGIERMLFNEFPLWDGVIAWINVTTLILCIHCVWTYGVPISYYKFKQPTLLKKIFLRKKRR